VCPGFPEITNFLSMNGDFEPSTAALPELAPAHALGQWYQIGTVQPRLPSPRSVRPSTEWEALSVSYFLHNFVSNSPSATGYLQFLPKLWTDRGDTACLRDALHATAMASFANVSNSPELQLRSERLYGRALRSTRDALQVEGSEGDDALLTSVFLLQKREVRGIALVSRGNLM
jgi:hypothetical protein